MLTTLFRVTLVILFCVNAGLLSSPPHQTSMRLFGATMKLKEKMYSFLLLFLFLKVFLF